MRTEALTVLIAEDDPEQLAYLSRMVRRLRPDWRIVAEVTSSVELERALENLDPSLALLDVHFSGKTALEILRGMHESCPVIFVTGDPTCAAEAYSCDVLDLVLKPVRPERLEQALHKVEAFIAAQSGGVSAGASPASNLIMLKGQDAVQTPLSEVRYFQAQRKYTRVVLKNQEGLLREGISSLMPKLNGCEFWRIHRGLILNVSHMNIAKRDELGRLMVHLRDRDEKLPVSRPYEHLFRDGFPCLSRH